MKTRPEADFSSPLCQPYEVRQGEHGVLLMHGFAGSAAHMRPLAEGLVQQGFWCAHHQPARSRDNAGGYAPLLVAGLAERGEGSLPGNERAVPLRQRDRAEHGRLPDADDCRAERPDRHCADFRADGGAEPLVSAGTIRRAVFCRKSAGRRARTTRSLPTTIWGIPDFRRKARWICAALSTRPATTSARSPARCCACRAAAIRSSRLTARM